jgi:hypothetical protein
MKDTYVLGSTKEENVKTTDAPVFKVDIKQFA